VEDILRVICSPERKTGDFRLSHACGYAWAHRGWEFLQKQNYFYKKLSAWIWKKAYPVNAKLVTVRLGCIVQSKLAMMYVRYLS